VYYLPLLEALMKTVPFWTDNYPRPDDLAVSRLPEAVDVAIVGGGYTGLNAARVLAKGGTATAVLERNTIGWGASSRNGGMATTGIKQKIGNIFNMYGKELGRAFWQSSLNAIDLIGEIVTDEGLECDFGRKGHIALAYKPSHYESMAKKVDWYRQELGHRMEMVPKSDIHSEIGSDAFYGGMVDEYSAGCLRTKSGPRERHQRSSGSTTGPRVGFLTKLRAPKGSTSQCQPGEAQSRTWRL
jgi:choline dehydrogenase-like flavoprotein